MVLNMVSFTLVGCGLCDKSFIDPRGEIAMATVKTLHKHIIIIIFHNMVPLTILI